MLETIRACYPEHHREKTLRHVEEVAATSVRLAGIHGLETAKVTLAAMLHDISVIMTPQEMYETAVRRKLPLDPAEEKYHFLLHQRMSRIIAQERFGVEDEEILSAVECHTTLKKNAGTYDQVLFISDKISWDQEGHPPYYDVLKRMAAESLDEACRFYILYQLDHGLLLMPHRWILEACEDLQHRAGKSPEVQCPPSILSCRKDVLL